MMVRLVFVPNRPFQANRHLGRAYGVARRAVMIALAAMAVLYFAYGFGSFIFAGGQLATTAEPRYTALVGFPVFTPPLVLVWGLNATVAGANLVIAFTARRNALGDLPFLICIPTVVMVMFSLGLSYFFYDPNGPLVEAGWGPTRLSLYWVGAVPVVLTALLLLAVYIRLAIIDRRDRKRIGALEGYPGGDLSRYREMLTGDPEATREETEARARRMLDEIEARRERNLTVREHDSRRSWREAQRTSESDS